MLSIAFVQVKLMLIPCQFSLSSICVQVPGAYWWCDCKHSAFPAEVFCLVSRQLGWEQHIVLPFCLAPPISYLPEGSLTVNGFM